MGFVRILRFEQTIFLVNQLINKFTSSETVDKVGYVTRVLVRHDTFRNLEKQRDSHALRFNIRVNGAKKWQLNGKMCCFPEVFVNCVFMLVSEVWWIQKFKITIFQIEIEFHVEWYHFQNKFLVVSSSKFENTIF